MKAPVRVVNNNEKISYTVTLCINAAGEYLPPYILFEAKNLYNTWCVGGPKGACYNTSPSGWMEAAQFLAWFSNVFVPRIVEIGGKLRKLHKIHSI
jgi:hypothetical protein